MIEFFHKSRHNYSFVFNAQHQNMYKGRVLSYDNCGHLQDDIPRKFKIGAGYIKNSRWHLQWISFPSLNLCA